MEKVFLAAIRAIAALDQMNQEDQFAELRADVDALNAKVRERLPRKPDGTAYTAAEVDEALARANAPLDEIDRRHSAQGDGDQG